MRAVVTSKAKVDDGVTDVLEGASNKSCAGGIILRIVLSPPRRGAGDKKSAKGDAEIATRRRAFLMICSWCSIQRRRCRARSVFASVLRHALCG